MLIITKEKNSIKVVGQNNPTYPYSGTLVYPLNSVTVVTDQSNMAVFRSALNNDVLFTGLIDDITINGSPVTKEDIGNKFGAISSSGTSIKTINSQSLLGEGNIEITVEGGGILDAPNDGKLYARKNAQWSEIIEATTSANGLMSSTDKAKLDSIDVASIISRITALETQMGEVSAKLDSINGEIA